MDAILLAGGFGTRLRPLTYTRPKPLLPVAGRPMVEWVLDRLPKDVDRLIVAVNWQAAALARHFATTGANRRVEAIVVEEAEPLGTGGAVKNAEAHIRSDRFFVLNADIVSTMDLNALAKQHVATKAVGTIAVKEVAPAEVVNFGVVDPDPVDPRRIRGFVEKPSDPALAPSRLINAGAYLLERSVLDLIPAGKLVSMEKEVFPQLIPKGFYGHAFRGQWVDVGDPVRLREASRMLDPKFTVGPESTIGKGAKWTDSLGGSGVNVGAGATVQGCILGDNVTVQPKVQLKDCVVGDGETVTRDATGERLWSKPIPEGYPAKQVGNAIAAPASVKAKHV